MRLSDLSIFSEFDSGADSVPMHPFETEGRLLRYDTVLLSSSRSFFGILFPPAGIN